MSLSVTHEDRNDRNADCITRNADRRPLSNAERQARYRERQKAKPRSETYKGPKRSAKADNPKRPCPPTPVAEEPYIDPDRPSLYSEDIATEICDRLAHGETLVKICRSEHIPSRTTVLRWVQENRQNFGDRFARARDLQFEHWADNLADIADSVRDKPEQVPAARLDSENKRWLLARLKPSLYSEKFSADITSAGKPLASASDLDIAKALAHALQVQALPGPVIDAEAVEVKPEGEQS